MMGCSIYMILSPDGLLFQEKRLVAYQVHLILKISRKVIGIDCICSCKSNYHTIMTMMVPYVVGSIVTGLKILF